MVQKSRPERGVGVILTLCLVGFTGCMGMDNFYPPSSNAAYMNYYANPRVVNGQAVPAGAGYGATLPPGGGPRGDIQQVSYQQQRAQFGGVTTAVMQNGEIVVEQPGLGFPAEGGMIAAGPPLPTEKAMSSHPPHR